MALDINLSGEDLLPTSPLKQIVGAALNSPVLLSDAPTTTNGILSEMKLGFYSGNLYLRIKSNLYKISLTLVP